MSEDEVDDLITYLADNPDAGIDIAGTGGCRKVRRAGRGKGKSGGYRIFTFFSGEHMPVFLLTVFSKGERANLTKADRNQLSQITRQIVEEYRTKIVKVRARR